MNTQNFIKIAKTVIEAEANALTQLCDKVGKNFIKACELCLACEGRVVVTGMGKSGHIANKIAATLASTGTPAFFLHPAEACHGDLGMLTEKDVVIAISNSGNTAEIVNILYLIDALKIPLITLTGEAGSTLAKQAAAHLDVSVDKEACPLNLAPTSSTTAALAMGDALALTLLEARGFNEKDFARAHPAGRLGKRLTIRVKDLMHTGNSVPVVNAEATVVQALVEMSEKTFGFTTVIDKTGAMKAVFTDGDVRRCIENGVDVHKTNIMDAVHGEGLTIDAETLAIDALTRMNEKQITSFVIVDENRQPLGVIRMHDILQAGIA